LPGRVVLDGDEGVDVSDNVEVSDDAVEWEEIVVELLGGGGEEVWTGGEFDGGALVPGEVGVPSKQLVSIACMIKGSLLPLMMYCSGSTLDMEIVY
jgi:hypothetical protein